MSYIYILTNESLPGIVKVGMTTKEPSERAKELHSTGVPTPFLVFAAWEIPGKALKEYEKEAHKILGRYRVKANREFFRIDAAKAKEKLAALIPTPENVEAVRRKANLVALQKMKEQCESLEKDVSNLEITKNLKFESMGEYKELLSKKEDKYKKYLHHSYGFISSFGEWVPIFIGIVVGVYFLHINRKHDFFVYAGSILVVGWMVSAFNKILSPWIERLEAHRWSLPDPHSVLNDRIRAKENEIHLIDRDLSDKNMKLKEVRKRMADRV